MMEEPAEQLSAQGVRGLAAQDSAHGCDASVKWYRSVYFYVLLGLLLIMLAGNACWLMGTYWGFRNDSSIHACCAYDYEGLVNHRASYPPLISAITHPLIGWLGFNWLPFFLVQAFFVIWSLVALFYSGYKLCNEQTGFWAGVAWLSCVQTNVGLRTFFLDYPLTAVVITQYALYLAGRRLKNPWYFAFFCLLMPVGGLIKQQYWFCSGPLFIGIWIDMFRHCHSSFVWKRTLQVVVMIACSLGLYIWCCGVARDMERSYYLYCPGQVFFTDGGDFLKDDIAHTDIRLNFMLATKPSLSTLEQMSRFLLAGLLDLKCRQLQSVLFWLYLLGTLFIWGYRPLRHKFAPVMWPAIFTSLVFALCTTNNTRYYAPLIPFQCLIATFWWANKRFWNVVPGTLLLLGGLVFVWGWTCPALIHPVTGAYLQSELLTNNMHTNFYQVFPDVLPPGECPRSGPLYMRLNEDKCNNWRNLVNTRSSWSDDLFFTLGQYQMDWAGLTADVLKCIGRGLQDGKIKFDGHYVVGVRINRGVSETNGQFMPTSSSYITNEDEIACSMITLLHCDLLRSLDSDWSYGLDLHRYSKEDRCWLEFCSDVRCYEQRCPGEEQVMLWQMGDVWVRLMVRT